MKIIFLLSFIPLLLFSDQTQIVIGSYSDIKNAIIVKDNLDKYIKSEKKISSVSQKKWYFYKL